MSRRPPEPEPDDPLRTLFQQAAAAGQARARTAPFGHVRARGRRAHRQRVAVLVAGACLVLGCGTAATAGWLPGESAPAGSTGPATRPPSPAPTPSPTTAPPPRAPSDGSTVGSSDGPSPPDGAGRADASATLPPNHPPTHEAGDAAL